MLPYHLQSGAPGQAMWSTGHFGEVSEATPPEAYVPRMMDQEYTLEDDPGSFLEPGWEEETLEVEAFQEPPGSLADHAGGNSYRVLLISQEQAYANHGSQVDQVTAADDDPSTTASLPSGGAHWGLQGRSREQGPSSHPTEQGVARR